MQSHIRKVYVCLAVTYSLHFWQNDRDLLCATAVILFAVNYKHRKTTEDEIQKEVCRSFLFFPYTHM